MRMDDYVKGISEIPYTWSPAVQRAQAVAARSYGEYQRRVRSNLATSGCWCSVRDTTSDQRYVGWGHSNKTSWINATNVTADRVLTHPASSFGVIKAYYSSSSGGNTEHGHLVGFANSQVEWLTSVSDARAVDGTVPNPNAAWTRSVATATVAQALGFDALVSARVTSVRPGSGSAAQLEFQGIVNGLPVTAIKTSGWARTTFGLKSEYFTVSYTAPPGSQLHPQGDEMLLYAANGTFRYNSLHPSGILGATINSGTNYTSGWKSIDAIDLDGDGQDEIMFYRDDGLYRYYEIDSGGNVGSPIAAGAEYTKGWDSITAIDLDGDGQDEIMFYREDGLYRYYDIHADGRIGSPIAAGAEYTKGWDSITAVDLDGDGQDEIMFYREDGLFRYYDIHADGRIGSPINAGSSYTTGWDVVTAVDLDSDSRDEMFFYRGDGLYRFYDVFPSGSLSAPLKSGSNFSTGWSVIAPINLDGS
jgi:SpoIID/LytB domain protein